MNMSSPSECVFCQIVAGAPASIVYEDDTTLAFLDIHPINPGHTLVIPKTHRASLAELDRQDGGHIFRVAMQVAKAIRHSGVRCDGINLHLADGAVAGQEIFHVHLHILPRFNGDGFRFSRQEERHPWRSELDHVASLIREAYKRLA